MTKERLIGLDSLRIIASIAIITIHTSAQSYFNIDQIGYINWLVSAFIGWIFMWGTPIFLMLSGHLLINSQTTDPKSFYKKRLSRILIPLLFWNIFYFFYVNHGGGLPTFIHILLQDGTYYHLYFLNIIAGLYLITPIIVKYLPKIKLNIVVPLLLIISYLHPVATAFLGFPRFNHIITYFIPYLGYYLLGYWLGKMPPVKRPILKICLSYLPLLLAISVTQKLVFIFPNHDQDTILVHRLSPVVAIVSIAIFNYFRSIPNHLTQNFTFITKLTPLTLGVYALHPLILDFVKNYLSINNFMSQHFLLWLFMLWLLTILLTFSLAYFIKKVPYINRII